MDNQQSIFNLIKELAGQSNVIAIPRLFIKLTGDLPAALFLSQAVYWSDKSKRRDGFFYKSYREWEDELGLTRPQIDRIRKVLSPYIEEKIKRAKGAPTLHYRVRMDVLLAKINGMFQNPQMESIDTSISDMQGSNSSDMSHNDELITEINTQSTHGLEPETSLLQHKDNQGGLQDNLISTSEGKTTLLEEDRDSQIIDYGRKLDVGIFNLITEKIKQITKDEKITLKNKRHIQEIASFVNPAPIGACGWVKEKYDFGYITTILEWAEEKVKYGAHLGQNDIVKALLNSKKQEEYRSNQRYQDYSRKPKKDYFGVREYPEYHSGYMDEK